MDIKIVHDSIEAVDVLTVALVVTGFIFNLKYACTGDREMGGDFFVNDGKQNKKMCQSIVYDVGKMRP
ncbi:hypothetical protein AGMMS49960_22090 [Betaproteobacteria bacterium]|nr:hypothetical protein AGMMS49960_22090 [Betaproteobacteria bacterium]GHU10695.1 hypothetical protein AGMMS50225_14690 [Betaproteobacteria bacterium]GHU19782.1 hypothetical protein AGMMS50243_12620 [Betaproteobacteria bacterium]